MSTEAKPVSVLPTVPKKAGAKTMTGIEIVRILPLVLSLLVILFSINICQFVALPLYYINQPLYSRYQSYFKGIFGIIITFVTQVWCPTTIRVSYDKSMDGQVKLNEDGLLQCAFADRLIFIANHQIYTDWLYIWWIAFTSNRHDSIFIILKEQLRWIPIIGWGMRFFEFIFLARNNRAKDLGCMAERFRVLNKNIRVVCEKVVDPMWLLIFPEGTNTSPRSRAQSQKFAEKSGIQDYKEVLIPRHTGLHLATRQLDTVDWIYNCTIAYEGVPPGEYGQDIYTLSKVIGQGQPPKSVNIHFSRIPTSTLPKEEEEFSQTLRKLWQAKDDMMGEYNATNRLPAIESAPADAPEEVKYLTTQVRLEHPRQALHMAVPVVAAYGIYLVVRYAVCALW